MINKKLHKQGKILILLLSISVLFSCSIIKLENKQKQQVPDKVQQAENLLARGVASYRQYNYTQAGAFFNKALYAYRSIDNPQGIILSLSNLAKNSLALGNVPLAVKYLTKAKNIIATAEKPFNNKIINHLIIVESSIKLEKKEYNSAIKILQPLLNTSHSPDSEILIAALQNRVRIAIAQHDPHTAQWLQQFSQSISNSQQDNHTARLLRFKAALSQNSDEQNTYYNQALKIYRDNANQVGIAATLEEWSQQQYQLKQYHAATDKLLRALFIRIDLKDSKHSTLILQDLYQLYHLAGDKEKEKQSLSWWNRLSARDFTRWNELTAAYNSYP